MISDKINNLLKQNSNIHFEHDIPLKSLCTLNIGGKTDIFIEPTKIEELRLIVELAKKYNIPYLIIGRGTNILFDDKGFRGMIIRISNKFSKIEFIKNTVFAQAGIWVPCLAYKAGKMGLSGIEHVIGIPGSFGGLIAMNGGSQKKRISDNLTEIEVIDENNNLIRYSSGDCDFGYRTSRFLKNKEIILSGTLKLVGKSKKSINEEMLNILKIRNKKFPRKNYNCGSVFKANKQFYNKIGSPGAIIEKLNLKGLRIGDSMVSLMHGNFIINLGNASSRDFIDLTRILRNKIYDATGILLDTEIRYVSESGDIDYLHKFL